MDTSRECKGLAQTGPGTVEDACGGARAPQVPLVNKAGLTIQRSKAPAGRLAAASSYALEEANTIQPEAGVHPGMVSSQGPSVSLDRPFASPSADMMYRFLCPSRPLRNTSCAPGF